MKGLKNKIREVSDWPKKGVNFKDITTILENPKVFQQVVNAMARPLKNVDKIVAIDARGFIVAAPVALKIKVGFVLIRKKGKLPAETVSQKYQKEYGPDVLEMHKDAISKGDKVVLVDDLIATGGTAVAACDLIEKLGGKIVETCFVIDLPFLNGSKKLKDRGYKVRSLVSYEHE